MYDAFQDDAFQDVGRTAILFELSLRVKGRQVDLREWTSKHKDLNWLRAPDARVMEPPASLWRRAPFADARSFAPCSRRTIASTTPRTSSFKSSSASNASYSGFFPSPLPMSCAGIIPTPIGSVQ